MFEFSFPSSADGALDNPVTKVKQRAAQMLTALPLYRSASDSVTRQRSDSDIEHPNPNLSGPSHVAWRGDGTTSPSPPIGAPIISRSASSPPLPPLATPRPKMYRHSSLKSTHSLRLESRYTSSPAEGHSHNSAQPLSPIVEQDYFSPEKRSVPLPPEHYDMPSVLETQTPVESDVTDVARPSPVYSTFLSRPLNRSISQNSSRTHLSSVSAPPSIPPLDLRPQFPPPNLNAPPLRTPHVLAVPILPTIVGTPNDGLYDDASSVRAESFMTAQSTGTPLPTGDVTTPSTNAEEFDIGVVGNMRNARPSPQPIQERYDRASQAELGSVRSMTTQSSPSIPPSHSRSSSSSFLDRRWLKGVSFGGPPIGLPERKAWQPRLPAKSACLLFWLGFIAPWCWLIGGWLLTAHGETKPSGQRLGKLRGGGLLPLWSVENLKKSQDVSKQGSLAMSGYPFIAPSIVSLPASSVGRTVPSESVPQMRVHWKWREGAYLDPWVMRCRVAAVASGCIICTAFIVAIIVVVTD